MMMVTTEVRGRVLVAVLSVMVSACARDSGSRPAPLAVTSVESEAYFVRRIAGGEGGVVEVRSLIPASANPVTFDPGFSIMTDMSRAVLYFKVGHPAFPLERTWLARFENRKNLRVTDTSRGIQILESDPHIWLSLSGARQIASNVAAGLTETFPEESERFERNLSGLIFSIDSLRVVLDSLLGRYRGRSFMVFHPAFGYLAAEFGLEQIAVERDGKAPAAGYIARLIERAKRERLKVVYVQPQYPSPSMTVIAGEIGARVDTLNPITADWVADLGAVARTLSLGFTD